MSASNCAWVSAAPSCPPGADQTKRPWFKRRAAHQTPKPSCTSSFKRVPLALAKRLPWWACAAPKTATTRASSRSVPARMSMGSVASHMASMRITAAARASTRRTRLPRSSATSRSPSLRLGATRCGSPAPLRQGRSATARTMALHSAGSPPRVR